jgi:hypothetical protein
MSTEPPTDTPPAVLPPSPGRVAFEAYERVRLQRRPYDAPLAWDDAGDTTRACFEAAACAVGCLTIPFPKPPTK